MSKPLVQELEELLAATPPPVGIPTETCAALLPPTMTARKALLEAAAKAERLGEGELHTRYLLLLAELDDLRIAMGEDLK